MKNLSLLLIFFALFSFTASAVLASDIPSSLVPSSSNAAPVKEEDIKNLIQTLESDSARKDFISNLQLLINQQNKNASDSVGDMLPALTEQIGVRGKVSHLVKEYEKFLEAHAISSSMFQQGVGTFVTLLVFSGLFLGVRRIALRIIRLLNMISDRLGVPLSRVAFYTRVLQLMLRILVVGTGLYTLSKIWEFNSISAFFEGMQMRSFLTTSVTVLIVAVIAAFIWEALGIYLSYILKQADDKNQTRVKTLLPIFRNIILGFFGLLFGLVILSELGFNVAPFLAGAGVIGVAIGFGAQTMVKDFISGFTIVMEDVLRVGDVASLAGCMGIIEKITLRKVQLRDFDGSVYTVPFSEITIIRNLTKEFSFYVLDVSVAYKEDTDRVISVMREVDKDMRTDPAFAPMMIAPIDIVGVERFDENAIIIRARLKTRPIKQWDVGREYNRRMKIAFDKNGIEIPFPQRVITLRQEDDKKEA